MLPRQTPLLRTDTCVALDSRIEATASSEVYRTWRRCLVWREWLHTEALERKALNQEVVAILKPNLYHRLYWNFFSWNFSSLGKGASLFKFVLRICLLRYASDSVLIKDIQTWTLCQSWFCCEVIKRVFYRAGEMAQALDALPEAMSSIPSNHMVAHNHL